MNLSVGQIAKLSWKRARKLAELTGGKVPVSDCRTIIARNEGVGKLLDRRNIGLGSKELLSKLDDTDAVRLGFFEESVAEHNDVRDHDEILTPERLEEIAQIVEGPAKISTDLLEDVAALLRKYGGDDVTRAVHLVKELRSTPVAA